MRSYPAATFQNTRTTCDAAVTLLNSEEACHLEHGEIEELARAHGDEFIRCLIEDHFELRSERERATIKAMRGADGTERTEVRVAVRHLATPYGSVEIRRLALTKHGASGGLRPLDACLNLPAGKHSHGVQQEVAWGVAQGAYDGVIANLRRTTAATIGKKQAEELVVNIAVDFEDFYLDSRHVAVSKEHLLVLTFDGAGVVMRPEGLRPETRKKAEKGHRTRTVAESAAMGTPMDTRPHRKRMAEVAAVYTLEVASRVPEEVMRELRRTGPFRPRPKAQNKRAWASLERPIPDVVDEAFCEAVMRDENLERRWVAVVDGNEEQLRSIASAADFYGVAVTVVIDFIHVLGKLWKAGKAVLGGSAPIERVEWWVDRRAERILRGKSSLVAAGIRRSATQKHLTGKTREAADQCCDYLLKHRGRLRYDEFLRDGLPIASGVIEGACRSLVKDRMDVTGARWGLPGAEAVLKLRSLRASGDLDDYLAYHFHQELRRVHLSRFAEDELLDLRKAA